MADLTREDELRHFVDMLIAMYGLAALYREVRSRPGFCGNCGCPLEGEPHTPAGMGACYG